MPLLSLPVFLLALTLPGISQAGDPGTVHQFVKGHDHVRGVPAGGARIGGDTVADAFVIPAIPFTDEGNTCGFNDDYDEVCPYSGSTSPDVVYAFTPGTHMALGINLCTGSQYDTKVYVYQDQVTPGSPYLCNDDYCSNPYTPYASEIPIAEFPPGHTYYIVIDGYGGDCGLFTLEVYEWCIPVIDCPPDALLEEEPDCHDEYVDDFNGGCNSEPAVFSVLEGTLDGSAFDVCGTSGTFACGGSSCRDTDWYELNVCETSTITFECLADFPLRIFVIHGTGGCNDPAILADDTASPFEMATLSQTLDIGVYWFWVGPDQFTDVPCGAEYVFTITGYVNCVVPTKMSSWGYLKSIYR